MMTQMNKELQTLGQFSLHLTGSDSPTSSLQIAIVDYLAASKTVSTGWTASSSSLLFGPLPFFSKNSRGRSFHKS